MGAGASFVFASNVNGSDAAQDCAVHLSASPQFSFIIWSFIPLSKLTDICLRRHTGKMCVHWRRFSCVWHKVWSTPSLWKSNKRSCHFGWPTVFTQIFKSPNLEVIWCYFKTENIALLRRALPARSGWQNPHARSHPSPVFKASASLDFHCSATSLAKGSSGLGALSNAWIDSSTVRICRAGDHLSRNNAMITQCE